jgi:hypothetical protein
MSNPKATKLEQIAKKMKDFNLETLEMKTFVNVELPGADMDMGEDYMELNLEAIDPDQARALASVLNTWADCVEQH